MSFQAFIYIYVYRLLIRLYVYAITMYCVADYSMKNIYTWSFVRETHNEAGELAHDIKFVRDR